MSRQNITTDLEFYWYVHKIHSGKKKKTLKAHFKINENHDQYAVMILQSPYSQQRLFFSNLNSSL